jgi:hypothetical protein
MSAERITSSLLPTEKLRAGGVAVTVTGWATVLPSRYTIFPALVQMTLQTPSLPVMVTVAAPVPVPWHTPDALIVTGSSALEVAETLNESPQDFTNGVPGGGSTKTEITCGSIGR